MGIKLLISVSSLINNCVQYNLIQVSKKKFPCTFIIIKEFFQCEVLIKYLLFILTVRKECYIREYRNIRLYRKYTIYMAVFYYVV